MWINLTPSESLINLDLEQFDDFENDDWEYLFCPRLTDSVSEDDFNLNGPLVRSQIGDVLKEDKPDKEIEDSENLKNMEPYNLTHQYSRRISSGTHINAPVDLISSRTLHKNSQEPEEIADHEIKRPDKPSGKIENRKGNNVAEYKGLVSQSSMRNRKLKTKNRRLSSLLKEKHKSEMDRISSSANEIMLLMENPHSWVEKLSIDYKDYARGKFSWDRFSRVLIIIVR